MDDIFPYYILEYRGETFEEVHTKHGETAVDKIKTVISHGIPKNFRKYCVDYVKRQRSRAFLPVGYGVLPARGTKNTRLT